MNYSSDQNMWFKARHKHGFIASRDMDCQFNLRIHRLTDRLLDIRLSINESENETLR